MAIGGYYINGYWSLLVAIILRTIVSYFINGYWWLFYQWLLVAIILWLLVVI
jgi:hypothetical protein